MFLLTVALGASFARADPLPAGSLISRTPYVFPFRARADWLTFVRGTENGADAANQYAAAFSEADFDAAVEQREARIDRIVYRSDGRAIRGVIVAPKPDGTRHPVVIYNHGGVMQWGRIILPELLEFQRLAARGYIVLASAYRGEGGSEGEPDMSGGDVADSLALIDVAAALPEADVSRIGMWGFSRGGIVTYAALRQTDRIAAAIIVGGPTDLLTAPRRAEFDTAVYPSAVRDYVKDKDAALKRISAIYQPEQLAADTPVLLLHGSADAQVPTSDSLRMAIEFQRVHRPYRLIVYEDAGHDLGRHLVEVRAEIDRWLDRYVRDRTPRLTAALGSVSPR